MNHRLLAIASVAAIVVAGWGNAVAEGIKYMLMHEKVQCAYLLIRLY